MRQQALVAALVFAAVHVTAQEQQPSPQPGWPCVGRPDPAYVKVAEASGGQVFLFDRNELAQVGGLMAATMQHEEMLFRAVGSRVRGSSEFSFPIDSAIDSLLLSLSLQCLSSIEIVRPSGQVLRASDPGIDFHQFQAGRIVTLPNPEPGNWRVRVAGRGLFFLVVHAKSALTLDRVEFVRQGGRPGHEGLFPTHAPPYAGIPQLLEIELDGETRSVEAAMVTAAFEEIATIPLERVSSAPDHGSFLSKLTPPPRPFRIVVRGVDASGTPFQRVHAPLFEPRSGPVQ